MKKDPSVLFRFYWLAKKIKPDIIHVWGHMVAFYAVPAKRLLNIPMINNEITDATPGQKLIGKSGTGKNGKYFYYGHKRKLVTHNDRHLQRCKIENVPAVQLEEAVVSRMKDLSTDRNLVHELVKSMASTNQGQEGHKKALIAAKEQECKKLGMRLSNLYDAISEESDRDLRAGLSQRAKETKALSDQAEAALGELRHDLETTSNVVDIGNVMEFIRIFREAFDTQPLSVQAEILRHRIRRLVVREGGIYVEVFGGKSEPSLLTLGNDISKIKNPTQDSLAGSRSGVRPVFKLVDVTGIEPATLNMPC